MKKVINMRLLILFCCLFVVAIGVGFSSFLVPGTINKNDKVSITGNGINSTDRVTLSLKYAITEGKEITYEIEDIEGQKEIQLTDETTFNNFYTMMSNSVESAPSSDDAETGISVTPEDSPLIYKGKGDYSGYKVYLYVLEKIYKKNTGESCNPSYSYYGKYTLKKQKNSEISKEVDYYGQKVCEQLDVGKGTKLNRADIENKLKITNDGNYKFVGLSKMEEDGSASTEIISFPLTIDSNITYYALINKNTEQYGYNIGKYISGRTTGEYTLNCGVAMDVNNLKNDASYFDVDNVVFLGDKSTLISIDGVDKVATKIDSDVIVNFGLNDGNKKKKQEVKNIADLEPEDSAHENQYTVCLQSDLYVYGTLLVGSSYGTSTNTYYEGHIAKEYVTFDLNGYNIYLFGNLECYGLIKDSKGTGTIYSYGGKIYTLAVVYDYRGGSATSSLASSKKFPFQVYTIPYFRCKSRFIYTSEKGWGMFTAICAVQTTRVTSSGIELNFIGPSSAEVLFKVDNGTETSFR